MKTSFGFFLLGQKGYAALKELLRNVDSKGISYVVIGQDKNIEFDFSNELKLLCEEFEIKYYYRNESVSDNADYIFAIGWRWIISQEKPLVVFHDSILPKYRGFAPLVNMLLNEEPKIGVTALFASDEYDKGNIIAQKVISIKYPIKIQTAINLISPLYADLVVEVCGSILKGNELESNIQIEEDATYSVWRDFDDYRINWKNDARYILNHINAVSSPYSGAKLKMNDELYTITDAEVVQDVVVESRLDHLGKALFKEGGFPIIICGSGLLKIKNCFNSNNEDIINQLPFRVKFN